MDPIIEAVLEREGGLTDDSADRGGLTNWGITVPFLARYERRDVSPDEIHGLTRERAGEIYTWFMDVTNIGDIEDEALRGVVFDAAVHHGESAAIAMLQRAIHVDDDGVIGPKTLAALEGFDGTVLAVHVCTQRVRLFGRIVVNNPSQAKFLNGWLNRACAQIEDLIA